MSLRGGEHCTNPTNHMPGELRVLPADQGARERVVCGLCFGRIMRHREEENKYLEPDVQYAIRVWKSLEPYTKE